MNANRLTHTSLELAAQRYEENKADVRAKLTAMLEWLDDAETERIHWGHVGSMYEVSQELDNIMRFIGLYPEEEA